MTAVILAVDGGNSKTDLALVRSDGGLLSLERGPMCSPHHLGVEGSLDVLDGLFEAAIRSAGLRRDGAPIAAIGELLVAGVDFPEEEDELRRAADRRGWAVHTTVRNDTFAVLRAGTERGWGVAVVCGAGINCVGVGPDGRHARFPALGPTTGDWGGGYDVGLAAVSAAARSEDGRGPKTALERLVPAHFGFETPVELAYAIHRRRVDLRRVTELAPLVLRAAPEDAVAGEILQRLADEVVTLARVALERLELLGRPVEVLLGGGLTRAADGALVAAVETRLRAVDEEIVVGAAGSAPIVGAALLGLDALGANGEAQARLRREFEEASHG